MTPSGNIRRDLLQLLTITNQCEISSSQDHRFENLAEGLTGGGV